MAAITFTVKGMTCDHCVKAVTEEVSALPGVTSVDVDLGSGRVDVGSESPLSEEQLDAAVDEAGYEIVR
ncbi:heavy-metal-associated domain-containing protein [Streptomonospora wellingtoniae]|uniref:Copper ion binding protein n=1 Tax=Streptomonospora wellingtoniae TaxID=3075544 RepID=A0ABU2KNV3_9ACTN|nr:copper ion binding protein [Streptomonospora sp. DSM 45055]MDT0300964.1 copper ion binding protein [Streptomonospora sp. DSM 45055]